MKRSQIRTDIGLIRGRTRAELAWRLLEAERENIRLRSELERERWRTDKRLRAVAAKPSPDGWRNIL
jgi:hypothetical protein